MILHSPAGTTLTAFATIALHVAPILLDQRPDPVEQAHTQLVQVLGTAPQNAVPGGAAAAGNGPAIRILNEPESGGVVKFLVNGQEQSLQPGETLDLAADRVQTIDFNTGGPAGDLEYSLYDGLYKFKVGNNGWGLFKSSDPIVGGSRALPPGVPVPPLPGDGLARRLNPAAPPASAGRPGTSAAQRPLNSATPPPPAPAPQGNAPEPAPAQSSTAPQSGASAGGAPESSDPPPPPARSN